MATETPAEVLIETAPRVQSLGDGVREQWDRIRGGEVGTLPVLIGIALIVVFFEFKNTKFLSPGNFVDLITQLAGPTIIAMGVVFVLLLGEIDLSAGLISGVGGVAMAELLLASHGDWTGTWWAGLLGIGLAIIVPLLVEPTFENVVACWTMRSLTVGMPSGRVLPPLRESQKGLAPLGMSTRLTACGT